MYTRTVIHAQGLQKCRSVKVISYLEELASEFCEVVGFIRSGREVAESRWMG